MRFSKAPSPCFTPRMFHPCAEKCEKHRCDFSPVTVHWKERGKMRGGHKENKWILQLCLEDSKKKTSKCWIKTQFITYLLQTVPRWDCCSLPVGMTNTVVGQCCAAFKLAAEAPMSVRWQGGMTGQGCDFFLTCNLCHPKLGSLKAAISRLKEEKWGPKMPANWWDSTLSRSYLLYLPAEDKIICHMIGTVSDCYCHVTPLFRRSRFRKMSHTMLTVLSCMSHLFWLQNTTCSSIVQSLLKKGDCISWQFPHILNTTETNLLKNVLLY